MNMKIHHILKIDDKLETPVFFNNASVGNTAR